MRLFAITSMAMAMGPVLALPTPQTPFTAAASGLEASIYADVADAFALDPNLAAGGYLPQPPVPQVQSAAPDYGIVAASPFMGVTAPSTYDLNAASAQAAPGIPDTSQLPAAYAAAPVAPVPARNFGYAAEALPGTVPVPLPAPIDTAGYAVGLPGVPANVPESPITPFDTVAVPEAPAGYDVGLPETPAYAPEAQPIPPASYAAGFSQQPIGLQNTGYPSNSVPAPAVPGDVPTGQIPTGPIATPVDYNTAGESSGAYSDNSNASPFDALMQGLTNSFNGLVNGLSGYTGDPVPVDDSLPVAAPPVAGS